MSVFGLDLSPYLSQTTETNMHAQHCNIAALWQAGDATGATVFPTNPRWVTGVPCNSGNSPKCVAAGQGRLGGRGCTRGRWDPESLRQVRGGHRVPSALPAPAAVPRRRPRAGRRTLGAIGETTLRELGRRILRALAGGSSPRKQQPVPGPGHFLQSALTEAGKRLPRSTPVPTLCSGRCRLGRLPCPCDREPSTRSAASGRPGDRGRGARRPKLRGTPPGHAPPAAPMSGGEPRVKPTLRQEDPRREGYSRSPGPGLQVGVGCVGAGREGSLPSLPKGSRFLSPSIRLKRGLSLRRRRHCPLARSSRLTSAYTLLPSSRTTKVYMAAGKVGTPHPTPGSTRGAPGPWCLATAQARPCATDAVRPGSAWPGPPHPRTGCPNLP